MAATKKTTTRKKPVAKKTSAKQSTSRSSSAQKSRTTPRKSTTSRKRPATTPQQSRSFRLEKQQEPFISTRITVQTLYWLILAGSVLLLGLWVLSIHNQVQSIYDEIDRSQLLQQQLDEKELRMLREKATEQTL